MKAGRYIELIGGIILKPRIFSEIATAEIDDHDAIYGILFQLLSFTSFLVGFSHSSFAFYVNYPLSEFLFSLLFFSIIITFEIFISRAVYWLFGPYLSIKKTIAAYGLATAPLALFSIFGPILRIFSVNSVIFQAISIFAEGHTLLLFFLVSVKLFRVAVIKLLLLFILVGLIYGGLLVIIVVLLFGGVFP